MTLQQYILLSKDEQSAVLWNLGSYLARRKSESTDYVVYELGDFFVEVAYSTGDNKFCRFKPFRSMTVLEPYWEKVELNDLKTIIHLR